MVNQRRIGKIRISEDMLEQFWRINKLKFIPYVCEFIYLEKVFEYIGISPYFDEVIEGSRYPLYNQVYKRDKLGRVKLINILKSEW